LSKVFQHSQALCGDHPLTGSLRLPYSPHRVEIRLMVIPFYIWITIILFFFTIVKRPTVGQNAY